MSSREHDFDLAVIGGGPAGAACALAAARLELTVALFEPQTGDMDKPCGEGLLPGGVAALEELELGSVVATARHFDRLRYVVGGARTVDVPLQRGACAVERPVLMRALNAALLGEPRVVRFAVRAEVEREAQGFAIRGAGRELRVRWLAAADGHGGRCAAWLRGERAAIRAERIGLRARFEARATLDTVEIHFGSDAAIGTEFYLTPLPEGRVNAALLLDRRAYARGALLHRRADVRRGGAPDDAAAMLARALEHHPLAARHLGLLITPPQARSLARAAPRRVAEGGVFLLGDAGGSVDPIVGCGLTIALRSGLFAARAASDLARGANERDVSRAYERAYAGETRARRRLAEFLMQLSPRPRLAQATAIAFRLSPRLVRAVAGLAEGGAPRAILGVRASV